jgi:hypothetical protein
MLRQTASHLLTIIVVATVVASTLGASWGLAGLAKADPETGSTEPVVRAFYAAVNRAIRSGNPADLSDVVAPDVVLHGPLSKLAEDQEGLSRYLVGLHATSPHLQLTVGEVVITRDRALVNLIVRGDEERTFLGSPLTGSAPWGAVDALRVDGGLVREYWSGATDPFMLEPETQTSFAAYPPLDRVVTLDRLTIPSGKSYAATDFGERRWLFVERGQVTVVSKTIGEPQAMVLGFPGGDVPEPRGPQSFGPGMTIDLPTFLQSEVRNTGVEPASLLVLAIGVSINFAAWGYDPAIHSGPPPPPAELAWPDWGNSAPRITDDGATITSLMDLISMTLPSKETVLSVAKATLAPGSAITAHAAGTYLLVVDRGELDLETEGSRMWVSAGDGRDLNTASLGVGGAAMVREPSIALLRNPGEEPTVVTTVAILSPEDLRTGAV